MTPRFEWAGPESELGLAVAYVLQHKVASGVFAVLLWNVVLVVYRLCFSPLAKFPGSKLAAATGWVETYHDAFRGGQFIFKVEEWHAKYGPVVRINPVEIHIADPDFVDVMFAASSRFDKKEEWKERFGLPDSSFDTIEHEHHRLRRSALAPFFSKQKINSVTGFIATKTQRLCDILEQEYRGTGVPVVLNSCVSALTFDIITYYAFARPFDYLEFPKFKAPFTNAAKELATTLHVMGHFPWLRSFLQSLPKSWAKAMNPEMGAVFDFHREIEDQIRAIISGANDAHKEVAHKTIFSSLINSDLPPAEKTIERLRHEGGSVVAGGVETTATAISKATFFVLSNPNIHATLMEELLPVFPDPTTVPPLSALESLPYLSGIVNETLRLSLGISSRSIRVSRDRDVVFKDMVIPKGSYFSMTSYYMHKNPAIWGGDWAEFVPERWIVDKETGEAPRVVLGNGNGNVKGKGEPLSKYLVAFGRGPRMCIGVNLARAELFIVLAILFRRLGCGGGGGGGEKEGEGEGARMELFKTTREAVEMKADYFIPFPDPKTEGVRVLVK